MKKTLFILSLILLVCTFSCSKDDDGGAIVPEEPQLKLTKVIEGSRINEITYSNQGKPETIGAANSTNIQTILYTNDGKILKNRNNDYSYNTSGRLETITDGITTSNFTYSSQGLMITQSIVTTNQQAFGGTENLRIQRIYVYDDQNRVTNCTETDNEQNLRKWDFDYNTDGDLVKLEETQSYDNGANYTVITTAQLIYDDKKNPAKLFYDSLEPNQALVSAFVFGIDHQNGTLSPSGYLFSSLYYITSKNIVLRTDTFNTTNGLVTNTEAFTYQYDGDYPISGERVRTNSSGDVFTSQLLWEYITD